jgi:hypothetical protein
MASSSVERFFHESLVISSVFCEGLESGNRTTRIGAGTMKGKLVPGDGGLEKRRLVQDSCFELGWRFCDNGSFMP